jgi:hypothetical protein
MPILDVEYDMAIFLMTPGFMFVEQGDKVANIREAVKLLPSHGVHVRRSLEHEKWSFQGKNLGFHSPFSFFMRHSLLLSAGGEAVEAV